MLYAFNIARETGPMCFVFCRLYPFSPRSPSLVGLMGLSCHCRGHCGQAGSHVVMLGRQSISTVCVSGLAYPYGWRGFVGAKIIIPFKGQRLYFLLGT